MHSFLYYKSFLYNLPIRGTLEKDKAKILEVIDFGLNHKEMCFVILIFIG